MKRSRSQAQITVTAEPSAKRKRSHKRSVKFPRNGVSATARAKLRYSCEVQATTTGLDTVSRHIFAANSLFDPDQTGAGVQPTGFDEWMTLYNLYTVVSGKASVHPISETSSTTTPQYYALAISDSSVFSGASVQALLSSCPTKNPGQPTSDVGIHRGALSIEYIKDRTQSVKWTAGGIMGMPQSQVMDRTTLQGGSASSPSDLIYCTLCTADVASAVASSNWYRVTMEFDVIFTNPKQLAMS